MQRKLDSTLMKKLSLLAAAGLLTAVVGCNRNSSTDTSSMAATNDAITSQTQPTDTSTGLTPTSRASNSASSILQVNSNALGKAVDNTAQNVRDRASQLLTPINQGNSDADTQTTQKIRQAIEKDSTLSTMAKNIKVITQNGKVTLRGPVNSAAEQKAIETAAQNIAGTGAVDDQLEVKATNQ